MFVREIGEGDLAALLALYAHLHQQDDPLPDSGIVETVWQHIQSSPDFFALGGYVDEQLICSCCLVLVPNLTRGCRPYGVIENVVTHEGFRGNAYGSKLLQHTLEIAWSNNCYKVMLMTGRLNEKTFEFYESVGFDRHAKQAFIAKPPKN